MLYKTTRSRATGIQKRVPNQNTTVESTTATGFIYGKCNKNHNHLFANGPITGNR